MIYLDYASTTPVDPAVAEVMQSCLTATGDFGNPSSQHAFGLAARAHIETAREQVAALVHCDPREVIWTSGATESINLALKGAALFYQRQGKHIITLSAEHKAVLDTCRYLSSLGFEMTILPVENNGLLDIYRLKQAIRPDTILASVMHVNNETGVIQDIAAIGACLRERGVLFHVDAAQSVGKIPIDLKNLPVDLMSLASHKLYGPKGIGALFVRRQPRVQLISQIHGGDQENSVRSGTLPTHQIVGMGMAYEMARNVMADETKCIALLRDQFEKKLSLLPRIHFNGDRKNRVCSISNFSIDGIDTPTFLKDIHDIALSQGSACNAVDPEPSHVLVAMGLSRLAANRSFRVSVGRFTTVDDIERASDMIINAIRRNMLGLVV